MAFSTASSAAVIPLSMKTADEKLGVSYKIS
ncbi:cation:dicarboxylate symporter family transporter [Polaribacter filamentus]|nr:cation:dicarboxylase symporter family transporter [Polaribacter filamentus]